MQDCGRWEEPESLPPGPGHRGPPRLGETDAESGGNADPAAEVAPRHGELPRLWWCELHATVLMLMPSRRRAGGVELKVTVKLFASLGQYLPSGAKRNQVEMEFPEGTTPADVVERLNVPRDLAHLVILNGVFLPPSERGTRVLAEREELAIFPPVAGG